MLEKKEVSLAKLKMKTKRSYILLLSVKNQGYKLKDLGTEQKPPEKPNLPKFVNLKKNPSKTEEKPASEPKQEVKNEWLKPKDTSHKGNYLDIPQQNPKRDGKADGKTNLQALDLPPAKKIPEDARTILI